MLYKIEASLNVSLAPKHNNWLRIMQSDLPDRVPLWGGPATLAKQLASRQFRRGAMCLLLEIQLRNLCQSWPQHSENLNLHKESNHRSLLATRLWHARCCHASHLLRFCTESRKRVSISAAMILQRSLIWWIPPWEPKGPSPFASHSKFVYQMSHSNSVLNGKLHKSGTWVFKEVLSDSASFSNLRQSQF